LEYSLPKGSAAELNIVFELDPPEIISHYRHTLLILTHDILGYSYQQYKEPKLRFPLFGHRTLRQYAGRPQTGVPDRVGLLSEVKHNTVVHYHRQHRLGNLRADDVLVNHGTQFAYYDKEHNVFMTNMLPVPHKRFLRQCMHAPPAASGMLDPFIHWVACGTKERMTTDDAEDQHKKYNHSVVLDGFGPGHLNLGQRRALSSLPLDFETQYANLLTSLMASSFNLPAVETWIFVSQMLYECGPGDGSVERIGHRSITQADFGLNLISQVRCEIDRLRGSWQNCAALTVLARIVARLHSMNRRASVKTQCVAALHNIRVAVSDWIMPLRIRLSTSIDEASRTDLIARLIEAALVGTETYYLDNELLQDIVSHPPSTFLSFSITIQQHRKCLSIALDLPTGDVETKRGQ
jgi:hypothetical protein